VEPSRVQETVLVVEDEELLRNLISEALTMLGYEVLAAASGKEALVLEKKHPGTIDLLVTDVAMDEMSGPQVAEAIVASRPATKVIFISGFPDGPIAPGGELKRGVVLLQKPFTLKTLAAKIREVLD
jgi:CheY-like chemotaxis protein